MYPDFVLLCSLQNFKASRIHGEGYPEAPGEEVSLLNFWQFSLSVVFPDACTGLLLSPALLFFTPTPLTCAFLSRIVYGFSQLLCLVFLFPLPAFLPVVILPQVDHSCPLPDSWEKALLLSLCTSPECY